MKKTIIFIAFISVLFYGCSKKTNQAPSNVSLIYPSENLLCINNSISFDWSDAEDSEDNKITYNIIIAKDRALTDVVEDRNTSSSQISLVLQKLVSYYWRVVAIDDQGNESEVSPTYAFFTKGDGVNNVAPFTAELVSPANNSAVNSGTSNLTWIGADSNTEDTLTYEVFFGEDVNPPSVQTGLASASYNATVTSGKTYYWKVNTTDSDNAKSIGQIWTFTVN